MADQAQNNTHETIERLEREVARLKSGLALLGVKSCCRCQTLFRVSEPGNLFDAGELVCYPCIREWWPERSPKLAAPEREVVEHKLVHWLLNYHGAKVIRHGEPPAGDSQDLRLVAACEECDGRGMWTRTRCHFCGGRGSLWVVIPKAAMASS